MGWIISHDWRKLAMLFVCLSVCVKATTDTEYKYARQRDLLEEKERAYAANNLVLSKDENIVKDYLDFLKRQEFERTRHDFPPSRPIELVLPTIRTSKVYSVLKKLPKGGNMHIHQGHFLDKRVMLDIIYNSDLRNYLYVNNKWELNFFNTAPSGWRLANRYPIKSHILSHITLLNVMDDNAKARPTDSDTRWVEMGPMFDLAGNTLTHFQGYIRHHLRAMFQAALDENVQYLEARFGAKGLYVLDDSSPGGHKNLDTDGIPDSWFKVVRDELDKFKTEHPEFIGYRDIIVGKRFQSREKVMNGINLAIRLRNKYPDIVSGFDLVAEEDKGYSLLHFIDDLAEAGNQSVQFYFHNAETNWPDDILASTNPGDEVSALQNVYEALILNTKRVGHGLGFIKHPYLMQELKERRIAVEANPVSNMLLGYVTDQRHHPAMTYIRSGIPVVMGADDPGAMGYNEFTVDWYEAFMAWGLNLKDLKQLAINSLTYSTMNQSERKAALQKWQRAWDTFITDLKSEACSLQTSSPDPGVFRIFPNAGPLNEVTKVRVFGRNFHRAICKNIVCQFGGKNTTGEYVHTTMVKCPTPDTYSKSQTIEFKISFDSGNTLLRGIDMSLNFTFSETIVSGGYSCLGVCPSRLLLLLFATLVPFQI
ncbi:adenosine deaminase AGSA-like [Mya arenaria]|uniref:adenosine deaminase AGSA-like n=1 Tax=Mya arenaria TaxID=6604 RepID=UPI0022E8841C|nr:adenosine deaminase AGSA-like [Mya arenaria]